MAPKQKIPSIVECHSEIILREELERARASLSLAETEETWDTISNALLRITALLKGGACEFPSALVSSIRSMYRPMTSAAASERSRLSAAAVECIATLASGLGPSFDPLVPLFIPALLSICSRPNKVFISRAKATIQTIIDQTQLISLLQYFVGALRDKSVTLRLIALECLLACVQCFNPPDLEKDVRARDVENAIRLTATDASADVRKVSKHVFDAYKILLPARVESFVVPLSPTMKKYLNVDIPSGNSRPQSSQSTYTLPVKRPASSLASAPPKQEEPHPRPATSTGHHRSASSSSLASAKSLTAKALSRSETTPTISTLTGQPVAGPSSKRRDNMPPPAIVPQRRQQVPSHPQVPMKRPLLAGQLEPQVVERPPEASSSRAAAQILRPGSTQPSGPPAVKQSAGPLRIGAITVKERLLGGPQRVLLPDVQPPPAPSKPPLVPQEKKVSAGVQGMSRRSRLDSVRHGPKSSAAVDAKQAVTRVSATSLFAPKRPEPSQPAPLAREKVVPIQATERKRDGPKPHSSGKGKGFGSKIPNVATEGEKGAEKRGSAPDRPKSSMSTRSISQGRVEAKPRKEDEPKGARPGAGKTSQSTISSASTHTKPPKKVTGRTGGATQPTLSQLARMKAAEEEKERRAATKGPTKPLTIRSKGKAVHPRATSKVVEIPAAAIATPLPPSPEVRPADIPLPVSPLSAPLVAVETRDEQIVVPSTTDTVDNLATDNEHPPVPMPMPTPVQVHPAQAFGVVMAAKTPISALVGSIQRGFLLSPNSPLSPAQPDVEWECPAWPGLALNVGEEPSFEGVVESTMKRPLLAAGVGTDPERVVVDMN